MSELLSQLKGNAPQHYERLENLLREYQIFLVANMVKSNSDLKSPEIIQSVCTDFLSLQPEIMGHVGFDPAIEAAVNHMTQFPLNHKKSRAGGDLAQIALRVVKESMLPRSNHRPQPEAEEGESQVESLVTQPSYAGLH